MEGDKADEIITYHQALDYITKEISDDLDPDNKFWEFEEIIGHQNVSPGDPSYKGSSSNVLMKWQDGSMTYEPLGLIAKDAPVACALYAKQNGLLDQPGWKRFKSIAKREKKLIRMLKQAKLKSFRNAPIYQFGYQVPRTPEEAIAIDTKNGNTKWQDSMALEISQLNEYNTFTDYGKGGMAPKGYKKIRVHFVFAVKHDGRFKSRLCAGGHLTDVPLESVYSGVVSLRSIRTVIFLGELNDLITFSADVGNAYLEAETKEKVYIVAGKGFSELEGHTLVIFKALYGLRSSGLRYHEKFSDTMRDMGYNMSKADPDVWMKDMGDHYEYIAVYVDDLAIVSKDPQSICDTLTQKYKYKLKGVGPITYHLGCDFRRDKDGTLCVGPVKYIEKMMTSFKDMFGKEPKSFWSPLEKNDHPEFDDSKVLSQDGIRRYQSMIGALQWVVSLGRFDIATAVMTMSRFRVEPREGHLNRLKRIYGYLKNFKSGQIRYRTGLPERGEEQVVKYDWAYSVYGNCKEAIPKDAPKARGKTVDITTYVDANLFHDLITGRAVTGILHFFNGTPMDWYTKRQATVETATYSAEFVAARIAVDQIIELRNALRYLGVPIVNVTRMFGDNESVVTSSTKPHSLLSKRHQYLSYHRVREAIAAGFIDFKHISGASNPADMLSKHCGYPQMKDTLIPLLLYMGTPNQECRDNGASDGGECRNDIANEDRESKTGGVPDEKNQSPGVVNGTEHQRKVKMIRDLIDPFIM